jgi:hypothetical protein
MGEPPPFSNFMPSLALAHGIKSDNPLSNTSCSHMYLKGWTPVPVAESDTSTCISSSSSSEFHVVVKELQQRDIYVQDGNGSVFLLVLSPLSPWLTLRGARKLLCPGVRLHVLGLASVLVVAKKEESRDIMASDTCTKDTIQKNQKQLVASSLVVTAALPASPYIARLLSCPVRTLGALFPCDDDGATTVTKPQEKEASPPISSLAYVLRPCSLSQCRKLYEICQAAKQQVGQNQQSLLFKNADILQLTLQMRVFQGWSRPHRAAPTTSRQSWQAVLRMEQQWCRESDGTILHNDNDNNDDNNDDDDDAENNNHSNNHSNNNEEHPDPQRQPDDHDHDDRDRLIFGNVNVDPLLNLPDPTDKRRVKYIEERKRPQIQWMLQLILQRVLTLTVSPKTQSKSTARPTTQAPTQTLQLVDVGGGRGDLAMALAAYYLAHDDQFKTNNSDSSSYIYQHPSAHITVIDINPTSLEAGKARAAAAGLDSYMSFVLCDLGDEQQIQDLLVLWRSEHKQQQQQQQDDNTAADLDVDLVFGLHCCGGVAEAAVELALTCQASFCVSTCCFRSHARLASLSRFSEAMVSSRKHHDDDDDDDDDDDNTRTILQEKKRQLQEHRQDLDLVTCLATIDNGQGQHCAIRAINAMRLVAAEERVQLKNIQGHPNTNTNAATARPRRLKTWQESFPLQYSIQNRVMIGVLLDCED